MKVRALPTVFILVLAGLWPGISMGQDCTPAVISLSSQAEVDDFQLNHGPCDRVTGRLTVSGPGIVSLSGLDGLEHIDDALHIEDNPDLQFLDGFSGLVSAGEIVISRNDVLESINGFPSLLEITGSLEIDGHPLLSDFSGMFILKSIGGSLRFTRNDALPVFDGLNRISSVSSIYFSSNVELVSIKGFESLEEVEDAIRIGSNPSLIRVSAFGEVSSLEEDLWLSDNDTLSDIGGLSGLEKVGGSLFISENVSLEQLDPLAALVHVGENVTVRNEGLDNCVGLAKLLDSFDDGEPGPGSGDVPDVFGDIELENLPGCDSVVEVIASVPLQNINQGLNDAWYEPKTDGQGMLITVFPAIDHLFLAWFTYDTERPPDTVTAHLGEPGHRWLTAQGPIDGNQAVLEVYVTRGGVFDSGEPVPVTTPDGEAVVDFSNCNAATLTYDIESINRRGTIHLERIVLDNVNLCYSLNRLLDSEATAIRD